MGGFVLALLPVIAIVILGRFLAWRGTITPDGWRGIERLSYVLLFPALIIRALASAPFETAPWRLAVVLIAAQVTLGGVGMLARFMPNVERPAVGSIIQSNVRWNTFVALSLASLLHGDAGLALVTIAAAAMIPTANVLSVYALIGHAEREPGVKPKPLLALLTNPLIIACAIGGVLAVGNVTFPKPVDDTLRLMGQATIALGLLTAGAGVDFGALKRAGVVTVGWSLVRLLGLPLLALGGGVLIGLEGMVLQIAVICAATPTATNSYILARQLGGDAPLAANLIAVQTVLAMITMPLVFYAALSFG